MKIKITDVKKAMEIHINLGDCKDCAYAELPVGNCERQMLKDALEIINNREEVKP